MMAQLTIISISLFALLGCGAGVRNIKTGAIASATTPTDSNSGGGNTTETETAAITPTGTSLLVNSGATSTASASLTLSFAATNASEMYISTSSTCSSGGTWEPFSTSKNYVLVASDGTQTLSVKYRSTTNTESDCISQSILLDTTGPSTPSGLDDGVSSASFVSGPAFSWTASTDTGVGLDHYEVAVGTTAGASDVSSWTNVGTNTSASLSGLTLTQFIQYFTNVRAVDLLGNVSSLASGDGWYPYFLRQEAYVKASNSEASDQFGFSVAINGDTMVVGVPNESSNQTTITNGATSSSNNSAANAGAAYVFVKVNDIWQQQAYLKAPNANAGDSFGWSVGISGDTIVVGAVMECSNQTTITNGQTASANNSASQSGAAYVFVRSSGNWSQQAYLKAPNAEASDNFGWAVAIDGDTIAVSAVQESSSQTTITNGQTASADNSAPQSGATYVFVRSSGSWSQQAYLKASNAHTFNEFGWSVSVSGDSIAVGSPLESSNQATITNGVGSSSNTTASESGAAFVYARSGGSWTQEAYLKAPNVGANDHFGLSIAMSGDTIVVGAHDEDSNQTTITNGQTASSDNSAGGSGAAYVFVRSATQWSHQAYLKASNGEAFDMFGYSVGISGDIIVVGAPGEDSNQTSITNAQTASSNNSTGGSGAAYVFSRIGTNWTQQAYLKAPNSGGAFGGSYDFSGSQALGGPSVGVTGQNIVVGASRESSNQTTITNGQTASPNSSAVGAGAAYIFKL